MTALPDWMVGRLTAEDYEALPEDVCRQIEIVDGAIVMSPSPRRSHQWVADGLVGALRVAARPQFRAVREVDLRLRDVPLLNRRPDVVVYDSSLPDDQVLRPAHCLLVVEVMSPGSVTTDRVDKPAEYAAAGIGHFWRAELDDEDKLAVFRYRLDPMTRSYGLVGTHTDKLVVSDPLVVSIDLGELR